MSPLINSSLSYRYFHDRPGERSFREQPLPKLVVIMPALNEEQTVTDVILRVPRDIPGVGLVEVIVVDDGSNDRTVELAQRCDALVVSHTVNLGVGAAVATGLDAALRQGADIVVSMDADGQFRPEDIPTLIEPILAEGYGLVIGTRFRKREFVPEMPWIKKAGGKVISWLVNAVIWGGDFTDVACGYRAYTRDTALRLNLYSRFTYTQEMIIDAASKSIRMTEVPIRVRGEREFGTSRVAGNLFVYAAQTAVILFRAIRDTRPLMFFGSQSLFFLLAGLVAILLAVSHEGRSPTQPVSTTLLFGCASLIVGTIIGAMALLADQLGRNKRLQETMMYMARSDYYRGAPPLPRSHRRLALVPPKEAAPAPLAFEALMQPTALLAPEAEARPPADDFE